MDIDHEITYSLKLSTNELKGLLYALKHVDASALREWNYKLINNIIDTVEDMELQ